MRERETNEEQTDLLSEFLSSQTKTTVDHKEFTKEKETKISEIREEIA